MQINQCGTFKLKNLTLFSFVMWTKRIYSVKKGKHFLAFLIYFVNTTVTMSRQSPVSSGPVPGCIKILRQFNSTTFIFIFIGIFTLNYKIYLQNFMTDIHTYMYMHLYTAPTVIRLSTIVQIF